MLKQCLKWTGVLLLFMHQGFGQNFQQYVDPKIGNVSQLLQPTRPTAQLPNQVMRMHPVRADYIDDQIRSFPMLVVSHRLGEVFAVKPYTGAAAPRDRRLASTSRILCRS